MGVLGLLAAIGSAVLNGSFIAPKMFITDDEGNSMTVKPMVFQLYCAVGVFVSSILVIPLCEFNADFGSDDGVGTAFEFSPLGFLAGILFVVAIVFSFLAVESIGLALGQGVWGGLAILVGYIWGVVIFEQTPNNVILSVVGVVVLIVGVVVIAFCSELASKLQFILWIVQKLDNCLEIQPIVALDCDLTGHLGNHKNPNDRRSGSGNEDEDEKSVGMKKQSYGTNQDLELPLLNEITSDEAAVEDFPQFLRGFLQACVVGLSGGSIFVPLNYVPKSQTGLVFLPSFGMGALVAAPMAFEIHCRLLDERPPMHFWESISMGLLSGLLFTLASFLSVVAIPMLGYTVASCILQCAIFISGIWGIFVFKEIVDKPAIFVFFIGGLILISGAVLLSIA